MEFNTVKILMIVYLVTLVINMIVSGIQWGVARGSIAHKCAFFYWASIFASMLFNLDQGTAHDDIVIFSAVFTFASNWLLISFFSNIMDVKIRFKPYLICFVVGWITMFVTGSLGAPLEVYGTFAILGAVSPAIGGLYTLYKHKKEKFTIIQKIFFAAFAFMTIHYLDWPWFRQHPDLLFIGMCLAMACFHMFTILMPMIANDWLLKKRNRELEQEVLAKANKLTETQMRLWEANKFVSLGQLAGGVSHEINNPLQVIGLNADHIETLLAKYPYDRGLDVQKRVQTIQNTVTRISDITKALRRVARIEKSTNIEPCRVSKVIYETVYNCSERIEAADVNVSISLPDNDFKVNCNQVELSQVILNLLTNAIDSVETLGRKDINIRAFKDQQQIKISVTDSGNIDPTIVPRIMDPFFTTKQVGKGTGLGLSISKSIIDTNGGKLYLDKDSPTTRFVIEFPDGALGHA